MRFSISLHSSELSSLDSISVAFVLSGRLLDFFSIDSISFNLVISSSCSLNLPNNVVVVRVVKSLISDIAVTLGWQLLSKHLRILMFNSSLSNYFPSLIKWLTIWLNRLWTSTINSPCCILNISYSWMSACFLALFTSFVPSCVTSNMSHISFAELTGIPWRIH